MTTVGKLLVIMNLVFSLVVGAFAVMDYTARTHWAEGYKKLSTQYAIAAGSAAGFQAQRDQLANERALLNAELAKAGGEELKDTDINKVAAKAVAVLENRARIIDNLKKELRDRDTRMAQLESKIKATESTSTISVEDVKRRQADQEKLTEQLNSERTKNNQLVLEKNKYADEKTAAEIDRDAYKSRAERLADEYARLEKEVVALRAAGVAPGRPAALLAKAPPPSNVEGLVKRADQNLITISIGSDSGIQKDHELFVYRLGANPKYVGKVRIVEVTPKGAVAEAVGRTNGPMMVNDRVGTNILGRD
jgi:hypothetical protein